MRIGSLFSGVGGLELGLERAGLGRVVWQVEKDEFCRRVLAMHWPEAERFDDVCQVGAAELPTVDLICGGFPCQDVSAAGKGAGLAGSRSGLWREFARIVAELRPRWVVIENVTSGASRWLDEVVRDLEELGYETLPLPVSAWDVGAPHLRRRLFAVAHANGVAVREQLGRQGPGSEAAEPLVDGVGEPLANTLSRRQASVPAENPDGPWLIEPDVGRVAARVPARVDRLRALGNSVVPQCAEVVGWVIRELRGAS